MIVNPAKLEAAFYTFDTSFKAGLETVTPLYPKYCKTVTSASRSQRYAWAANVPGFVKWAVGTERLWNNLAGREYEIANEHFSNGIQVSADDVADDQIGIYQDSMRMLGVNAGTQPDVLTTGVIEAGSTTGYGYDEQLFFSTAHPVSLDNPGLGTYSNLWTAAGSGTKPLSAASFAFARQELQSRKLENGLPLALGKLTLIVPPALRTTAEQILNSTFMAPAASYGAIAAQASDNVLKGAADLVVNPYLTSATTCYLTTELSGFQPFIFQTRSPMRLIPLINPTDNNVVNLNVFRYAADVRNAAGFGFPQMALAFGA